MNPLVYSIWGGVQQLVHCQKFKNIDHLKQVLNSEQLLGLDMTNQELINSAIDQWSKRLLLVVCSHDGHIEHPSVNPVICACCKLFLSWIALKMLSVLMFFWVAHLPCAKQRIFNSTVQTLPFLVSPHISEHFGENRVTLWVMVVKLRRIKLCAFFTAAPCIDDTSMPKRQCVASARRNNSFCTSDHISTLGRQKLQDWTMTDDWLTVAYLACYRCYRSVGK